MKSWPAAGLALWSSKPRFSSGFKAQTQFVGVWGGGRYPRASRKHREATTQTQVLLFHSDRALEFWSAGTTAKKTDYILVSAIVTGFHKTHSSRAGDLRACRHRV